MLKVLVIALAFQGMAVASTIEVVRLYQPLSLHGTDGVGEVEDGEDLLQAAVLSRPFAVSGALPEDLVKAVAYPHRIPSNNPNYDLEDANLLNLCHVRIEVEMKGETLRVRFDVSKLEIPERVDLTSRQMMKLAIQAVRQTVREFMKNADESLDVSIGIVGTGEELASLKDLATRFRAGD